MSDQYIEGPITDPAVVRALTSALFNAEDGRETLVFHCVETPPQ